MKKTGIIKIEANIDEHTFIENLLMQKYAGQDVTLLLVFYAFAHQWHMDKLGDYFKLLGLGK